MSKNSISGTGTAILELSQIFVSFPRRTSRVSVCWCTVTSLLPRTGGSWCSEASSTGNTCPRKIRSAVLPVSYPVHSCVRINPCHSSIIKTKEKREVLAEMITVVLCLQTQGYISSAFDLLTHCEFNPDRKHMPTAVLPVSCTKFRQDRSSAVRDHNIDWQRQEMRH